jgi:hypothetical protein
LDSIDLHAGAQSASTAIKLRIEAVKGHLENRQTPFAVFDDPAVYGWWKTN